MFKRSALCVVLLLLPMIVSCGNLAPLILGLQLLNAINAAPEGEKVCAAFGVLEAQNDPATLAGLINFAAEQQGKPATFTTEDAQTLLNIIEVLNCEFISCFAEQKEALDPPADDAAVADWVEFNLTLLRDIAEDCPSPTTLTEEEFVDLVRFLISMDL